MNRPSIDETLMEVAYAFSKRSTCSRRNVGCVISDWRGVPLSTGYNGAISGFPHCELHTDYEPCHISIHGERNAIVWAARRGIKLEGAQAHITDSPCVACAKELIQVGIRRVVYDRPYRDDRGVALLLQAGVQVVQFDELKRDVEKESPDETTQ